MFMPVICDCGPGHLGGACRQCFEDKDMSVGGLCLGIWWSHVRIPLSG